MKITLTETERTVIDRIGDERFNADYVQHWISGPPSSYYTAETAEAIGFYWAVHQLIERGMVKGD